MSQTSSVTTALSLTLEMEHAATLENWVEVARLSLERSPLLMSLQPQQEPEALAAIRRIQSIDAVILSNARVSRDAMVAEFGEAIKRVRSVNAYHRVARM